MRSPGYKINSIQTGNFVAKL